MARKSVGRRAWEHIEEEHRAYVRMIDAKTAERAAIRAREAAERAHADAIEATLAFAREIAKEGKP